MAGDIVQVSIGDRSIGIVGLKKVMTDLAATATGKTDEECREILYRGIAEQNYMPPKMVEEYKDALLRAFKAFTGETPEETPAGGVRIQVLGPGCHNCDRMEQDVREVLAELRWTQYQDLVHGEFRFTSDQLQRVLRPLNKKYDYLAMWQFGKEAYLQVRPLRQFIRSCKPMTELRGSFCMSGDRFALVIDELHGDQARHFYPSGSITFGCVSMLTTRSSWRCSSPQMGSRP